MKKEKIMEIKHLAHIRYDDNGEIYHLLEDHLYEVGELAARFAGKYGEQFARQGGYLHDLGKAQEKFLRYIQQSAKQERENAHIENPLKGRIPHSTAGAKYAINNFKFLGCILAYIIAGHHSGLADWKDKKSLENRLAKADKELEGALSTGFNVDKFMLSEDVLNDDLSKIFSNNPNWKNELHIWIRFLFSCLVDADFLDTEAFMKGYRNAEEAQKNGVRPSFPSLSELQQRYEQYMQWLMTNAQGTPLQDIRSFILNECLSKAEDKEGVFSLTVPTGGGKTLASLGFALKHALKFGKKRIIYAIPFTSIIEQNADVFRRVLGEDALVEHHSNLDIDDSKETSKQRIAAENWDAPLIVTTNVQFFESLFAARTSRCRKIHNIADSVVILDEAQQLPRDFQKPITDMIRTLAKSYGVTFVLCTATQPELGHAEDVFKRDLQTGVGQVTEIMSDPNGLAERLRRVTVHFPISDKKQSWEEIAHEIAQRECVLAIVNTRSQAKKLFSALPDHGIKLHLSANMCAEHRSEVLGLVRVYLRGYHEGSLSQPLWLISTQLVEAGVDIDFPVVYRQMAGLDSIAQAAGRCNREGKLEKGEVVVFRAEQGAPLGSLKQGQDITEEMLKLGRLNNPLSPHVFKEYFERFNYKGDRDKYEISDKLLASSIKGTPCFKINFCTAAESFRMIDQQGVAVIVPYCPLTQDNKVVSTKDLEKFLTEHTETIFACDYPENIQKFRANSMDDSDLPESLESWFRCLANDVAPTWVYRKLQRYTVNVPESYLKRLPKGTVYEREGLLVLSAGFYSQIFGAGCLDDVYQIRPEDSVI